MNVYDFDKTIYDGDCTIDFWLFWLKKHPWSARRIPKTAFFCVLFRLGLTSREKFKQCFYGFLKDIGDVEAEVNLFWDKNDKKIKNWYLTQKRDTDLVISASPDFLISEICKRLNVASIASEVDSRTGALLSPNCRGAEKVKHFCEHFPDAEIENFYSDSQSDMALAKVAQNAFLVKNDRLYQWNTDENAAVRK